MGTNIIKKEKVNEDINYKYKCEECGINFGYSLGDMELHKLTVHLQKGDVEIITINNRFTYLHHFLIGAGSIINQLILI